jgi:hypothetical protein
MKTNMLNCFRIRFSLRTLFVVLTVAGGVIGWISWQWNIVHHRRAMRAMLEANGATFFVANIAWRRPSSKIETIQSVDRAYKISSIRRWFGDEFVDMIAFNRKLTAQERLAIKAFPESDIKAIP